MSPRPPSICSEDECGMKVHARSLCRSHYFEKVERPRDPRYSGNGSLAVASATHTQLAIPGVLSETGFELPPTLTFDEWVDVGQTLQRIERSVLWWVGDWLRYGERNYGEMYAQALDSTTYSYGTLRNAVYVAGQVELSRRRDNLSWTHHAEVAALPSDDQSRWLDVAADNGWTVKELRAEIKDAARRAKGLAVASDDAPEIEGVEVVKADCLDFIASLPNGAVSLLLTDPPYAVTENEWDTWESEDGYWQWMAEWLDALRPKMSADFTSFIFCDADASPRLYQTLQDTGWPVLRQVIWHRPNLAKKRAGSITFLSSYEPFWHCGTRPLHLPDDWGSERFDVQSFVVPQSNHTADAAYHPTQKPLALMDRLVQVGSQENELVVDPFVGSGTTAVAAKKHRRRCRAADSNEEYVKVAWGRLA